MTSTRIICWDALDEAERAAALARPALADDAERRQRVADIFTEIRASGDRALLGFEERFDGVTLSDLAVGEDEFAAAERSLSQTALAAIDTAIRHVQAFHEAQLPASFAVETAPGVVCESYSQPLDSVGLYVPAGTAPLPSTAVMLCTPARLAGCGQRIVCTPPRADGSADPSVLTVARRTGVDAVFKLGGAQAIGAMAFGTRTVPRVCKIFGPGNAWVTTAKTLVAMDPDGAAIDMPAGPSEVLVIADGDANPEFVAADLLSQAEHGEDSHAVLVGTSRSQVEATIAAVDRQLERLNRREVAARAMGNAAMILVPDVDAAIEVSNRYAPEHLIVQLRNPRAELPKLRNAGSIFLGPWSPEAVGDYCSGTNHVLPTYGAARAYSGLGVIDFMRRTTVQELTAEGLVGLAPTVCALAELEGLDAHAEAVRCRLPTAKEAAS